MGELVKHIFKNKVIWYVSSRYLTYGIQFLNAMFIAIALGPVYIAVWGFINLVLQYIAQLNFGVPYSLNVLLSINKDDKERFQSLLSNSLFLFLILSVFILLVFGILYLSNTSMGMKYDFGKYELLVIFIAILSHFNSLFTNYFRVINKLWQIIILQSVTPIAMLTAYFFTTGESLLYLILWFMLAGQIIALLFFVFGCKLTFSRLKIDIMKSLLNKGLFLFIYNACFYLIMLSTRTVVSSNYEVMDFGFFTFSFTLANTIMLLFDSFSFLIYPKTINRFNKGNREENIHILNLIRTNYITPIHLVMYLFLIIFPFVIKLFPQYGGIFKAFGLMAITIIFYSNCFGYSSFLIANGKERLLSMLAASTLIINIVIALFISLALKASYEYVILATMIAYMVYNIELSYFSFRYMGISYSLKHLIKENFPISLFIPYFITLILLLFEVPWYGFVAVLFIFVALNWKQLVSIKNTLIRIIYNPSIINI